ncbi:MAG: hypothetical protein NTY53_17640, partial [Kiritimatiellaeota bacterium]|nr:hypothetical protein [Kiritimatiellota bacterium]
MRTGLLMLVCMAVGVAYGVPTNTPSQIVIRNPSMTEGTDKPVGWTDQWIASGKIAVSRDVATFHSAPAALAIASVGGLAHAQAMQFIAGAAGQRLRLSAWVRADGKANAIFGVQSYTAEWKGIEFKALGKAMSGFDWQEACGEVTLPPKTARFAVLLLLQGEGKAWLDDVSAEVMTGPAPAMPPKVEPPPKAANAWSPAEGFWKDFPQAW